MKSFKEFTKENKAIVGIIKAGEKLQRGIVHVKKLHNKVKKENIINEKDMKELDLIYTRLESNINKRQSFLEDLI